MKRTILALALLAAMAFPAATFADDPGYTYEQFVGPVEYAEASLEQVHVTSTTPCDISNPDAKLQSGQERAVLVTASDSEGTFLNDIAEDGNWSFERFFFPEDPGPEVVFNFQCVVHTSGSLPNSFQEYPPLVLERTTAIPPSGSPSALPSTPSPEPSASADPSASPSADPSADPISATPSPSPSGAPVVAPTDLGQNGGGGELVTVAIILALVLAGATITIWRRQKRADR